MADEINRGMDEFLVSLERDDRDVEVREAPLADQVSYVDWMIPDRTMTRDQVHSELSAPIIESFPDVRFEVANTMRDGDRLLVCGFFTGTMAKDYWGFPAHGRKVRWEARDIYGFAPDGTIDRIWLANDTLTVARELGAKIDDPRLW
jgi:predicted ester cyclase